MKIGQQYFLNKNVHYSKSQDPLYYYFSDAKGVFFGILIITTTVHLMGFIVCMQKNQCYLPPLWKWQGNGSDSYLKETFFFFEAPTNAFVLRYNTLTHLWKLVVKWNIKLGNIIRSFFIKKSKLKWLVTLLEPKAMRFWLQNKIFWDQGRIHLVHLWMNGKLWTTHL